VQFFDLGFVDVDTGYLMPQIGKAGASDETYIAHTDHANLSHFAQSLSLVFPCSDRKRALLVGEQARCSVVTSRNGVAEAILLPAGAPSGEPFEVAALLARHPWHSGSQYTTEMTLFQKTGAMRRNPADVGGNACRLSGCRPIYVLAQSPEPAPSELPHSLVRSRWIAISSAIGCGWLYPP
jgi:hypothetical protein